MKDVLIDLKDVRKELEFRKLKVTPSREKPMRRSPSITAGAKAQTTSSAEYIVSEIKKRKLGLVAALGVLLLASIGIFYFISARRSSSSNDHAPIDSIAVLPFQNRSGDAEAEYLSDGLAESLIYGLSQLPNLKVSPTSSVFRYKGKEIDPIKIGSELGVMQ